MWWITPPIWSALWAQTPAVMAHCTAPKYHDPHNDWPVIHTIMLVSYSPMIKPACSGSGQCQCDNVHKSRSLSCFWLVVTTFLTVCTHIQIIANRNQSNNLFTENHIYFFKKPTGHHRSATAMWRLRSSTAHHSFIEKRYKVLGLILCLRPANGRHRYKVTPIFIGRAQT